VQAPDVASREPHITALLQSPHNKTSCDAEVTVSNAGASEHVAKHAFRWLAQGNCDGGYMHNYRG